MHKNIKKLMAMILIAALSATLVCVPAYAEHVKEYSYYVTLGDSIPSGSGLQDPNDPEHKEIFNKKISSNYDLGNGFTEGTYPDLLADEYNIDTVFFGSRPGMRTTDYRYIFESDFAASEAGTADAAYRYFFQHSWGELEVAEDLQTRTEAGEFDTAIKSADLITINLGSNDILIPVFCDIIAYYAENPNGSNYSFMMDEIKSALESYATGFQKLGSILDAAKTVGEYGMLVELCIAAMNKGEQQFYRDWDALVADIRSLNENNADIVAVGLYNPMAGYIADFDSALLGETLNTFLESLYNRMSRYIHYSSTQHLQYAFADIYEIGEHVAKGGSYDKSHPDQAGHQIICSKILATLNNICRHWEWKTEAQILANTELHGVKEAEFMSPGYTGDRVCIHCGEVIQQGTVTTAIGFKFDLPENLSVRLKEVFNNFFARIKNVFTNIFTQR